MTENTTNNNDPWAAWVDWAREADADSEQVWQIINTILECSRNLAQSHTWLLKRVAVLETKAGIVPAAQPAPARLEPAVDCAGDTDLGARLIAQRQHRAATRLAGAESAPGADTANASAAIIAHASAVPEGR